MIEITLPSFSSPRVLWQRVGENWIELLIVLGITVIATIPRVIMLESIPPGLHGDEAIAGLEARTILDHGEIGPFSFGARGVPAGMFYFTSAVFAVLGESVLTLRLSFALLGIASVVVSYFAFRVMYGRTVAVIAALILSVLVWHLHYSRVAFIPIGWPLMQMATVALFFLALRERSQWLFGAAGVALGAGVYTYQAWPTFGVALGAAALWLAVANYRRELLWYVSRIGVMAGVALLVGLPMASFARNHPDIYLGRFRQYSVTRQEEYKQADGLVDKVDVLAGRELDYLRSVITHPIPDAVDASGIFPLVDRVTLGLIIAGGGLALLRARQKEYATALILTVAIGVGPALAEEGWYRRTLGIVPFLALFAALPLAYIWDEGLKRGPLFLAGGALVVLAMLSSVSAINLERYFSSYDDDEFVRWVYAADLADASRYVDDLPDGTFVYFYNDRHSYNYETRLFSAPDTEGEDRSIEFGSDGTIAEPKPGRGSAYLFLGTYTELFDLARDLYPGGEAVTKLNPKTGAVIFSAYFLPADTVERPADGGESRTPSPAQATATAQAGTGGGERDTRRVQDLAAVVDALEEYRARHGAYPETGGIQTLCAFPGLDEGCALEEVLGPLPADPLGDPAANGYWYESDGARYALFAQRQSEQFPECEEHPDHLSQFESVLCARGPAGATPGAE